MERRGDAPWQVRAAHSALRELDTLSDSVRREALDVMAELEEDPFPLGCLRLRGYTGLYRVKFYREAYRLVYAVSEKQRLVIVERVRPRATAYAGLRDPAR